MEFKRGDAMLEILIFYFSIGGALACALCIMTLNGQYVVRRTAEFTKNMSDVTFIIYIFITITLFWPKIIMDSF